MTISGCTQNTDNNKTVIIRGIENGKLTFYENTLKAGTESGEVTFKRAVPDMDVICESGYSATVTKCSVDGRCTARRKGSGVCEICMRWQYHGV